ncbi:FISUMP domain-containing protein [Flammeovirga aprica]|uniref:Fibrobacter succinogenes major paralogous domain-containing protein n=1 Tax=Flammeovirga aprica JL-4 TaxID=694437 RepID=A0A7X9P1J1_9BACT|nr:FISUMP domain-containing protein [Flammeovirga aprica]NME67528.1 hypothetical protein [Flammeovirga aprica JL-4]
MNSFNNLWLGLSVLLSLCLLSCVDESLPPLPEAGTINWEITEGEDLVDNRGDKSETYPTLVLSGRPPMTTQLWADDWSQTWMTENLRATHFTNGTPIGSFEYYDWVFEDYANMSLDQSGYTWAKGTEEEADAKEGHHGALYMGYVLEAKDPMGRSLKICPEGWHLPTVKDVQEFIWFLRQAGFGVDDYEPDVPAHYSTKLEWNTGSGNGGKTTWTMFEHPIHYSLMAKEDEHWNPSEGGMDGEPVNDPELRNATGFSALKTGFTEYYLKQGNSSVAKPDQLINHDATAFWLNASARDMSGGFTSISDPHYGVLHIKDDRLKMMKSSINKRSLASIRCIKNSQYSTGESSLNSEN